MVVTAVKPGASPGLTQSNGRPHYELWAESLGASNLQLEVWQLPSTATPHITKPVRIAGLKGRNLALIEHRVLRRLAQRSIALGGLKPQKSKTFVVDEDLALMLGLIFRVLAPMRSRDNMLACMEGIEAMGREEAAYWLGMAMHRKNPRRVLASLRMLMTD
ncbi:MAG: hypothetical protein WBG32_08535 [Nodosilinea sp.]